MPKQKVTVVDGSVIDSYDLCYIKVCFSDKHIIENIAI